MAEMAAAHAASLPSLVRGLPMAGFYRNRLGLQRLPGSRCGKLLVQEQGVRFRALAAHVAVVFHGDFSSKLHLGADI